MPLDLATLLPQVNEHARLITAGEMPPAIAADWLMDQGCTLRDVLLLFRGTPPDYQDGLHQAALVEWLMATEPGTPAPPDPRERGGVVTLIRRYEVIQTVSVTREEGAGYSNWSFTIRELKRRTLALFPEVIDRYEIQVNRAAYPEPPSVATAALHQRMIDNGFTFQHGATIMRDDSDPLCWRYWQEVPAPYWIPPESVELTGESQLVTDRRWMEYEEFLADARRRMAQGGAPIVRDPRNIITGGSV